MKRGTNINPNVRAFRSQRTLFLQGIGCLCGLAMLNGAVAVAQEASNLVIEETAAPSYETTQPTEAPVVEYAPTEEVPLVATPPIAPAAEPEALPSVELSPTEVEIIGSGTTVDPTQLATPKGSSDPYIDATPYQVGATSSYESPATIVLSERSSGCEAVVSSGSAVPGSLCPPAPTTVPGWTNGTPAAGQWSAWDGAAQSGSYGVASYSGSTTASGQSYLERTVYNRNIELLRQIGSKSLNFIFPLPIPVPITSTFGWRQHPIYGTWRFHSGTDLGADYGTPVLAAFAGRVTIAEFLSGYGLTVVMEHNQETQETLYAHLSELLVRPGDWVEQGTVIGRVGSTGNSTGPHLHFEVRQNTADGWVTIDPAAHLEYGLARLVEALKVAQYGPSPQG